MGNTPQLHATSAAEGMRAGFAPGELLSTFQCTLQDTFNSVLLPPIQKKSSSGTTGSKQNLHPLSNVPSSLLQPYMPVECTHFTWAPYFSITCACTQVHVHKHTHTHSCSHVLIPWPHPNLSHLIPSLCRQTRVLSLLPSTLYCHHHQQQACAEAQCTLIPTRDEFWFLLLGTASELAQKLPPRYHEWGTVESLLLRH